MAKKTYPRTRPDGYRMEDGQIKVTNALAIPVFAEDPTLNDNPDEPGYIGMDKDGRMRTYRGENVWDTLIGENDLEQLSIVTPNITVTWTLFKSDGVTPYSPNTTTGKNITVDKGAKAKISATFQYPSPDGLYTKAPELILGYFGTVDPGPDTPSVAFTNGGAIITSDSTYDVLLLAQMKGLIAVDGGKVVKAIGYESTSDSVSVKFLGKGALVYSTLSVLTASDIESLLAASGNTAFQSSKARTFTGVTASAGKYTYYISDAALGAITNAIQNGALPVFGAFTRLANVSITNDAGATINMIVFRSNAQNAFTGVTLAFS